MVILLNFLNSSQQEPRLEEGGASAARDGACGSSPSASEVEDAGRRLADMQKREPTCGVGVPRCKKIWRCKGAADV